VDPALVGLTVLAIVAGLVRLDSKSLWLDEAVSVTHARLGLSGLWGVVSGSDPNMGLYYVALHVWVDLFGYGQTSVRLLSVLLGALAIPAILMLGTRIGARMTGLAAALLLALAPFFVHYEQTVRSYALLVTLACLSSYFFLGGVERPSRGNWVGYVLTSVLAVYAHYLAALVLLVQALTLLALKRRAAFTRWWLTAGLSVVVLCSPEVVFAERRGLVPISWIPKPSFTNVVHLPADLAGGAVLAGVLIVLAGYGVARLAAEGRRWQAWFLAAWCVIPVFIDLVVSLLGRPLFLSYYLIFVLPALLLLAAAGLVRLPGRPLKAAALALILALSLVGLSEWYGKGSAEDYRAATRFLLSHARAGDAVFYDPSYAAIPFTYYESLAHSPGPPVLGALPGPASGGRPRRLWLVFRDFDRPRAQRITVERSLADGYMMVGYEPKVAGVTVILYRH